MLMSLASGVAMPAGMPPAEEGQSPLPGPARITARARLGLRFGARRHRSWQASVCGAVGTHDENSILNPVLTPGLFRGLGTFQLA